MRFDSDEIAGNERTAGSLKRQNWIPIANSATPAVATSSVTRGASNSGRITSRSVRSPNRTVPANPIAIAMPSGRSQYLPSDAT